MHAAGAPGGEAVHDVLELGAPVIADACSPIDGLPEGEGPLLGHRLVEGDQAQVHVKFLGVCCGPVTPGDLLGSVRWGSRCQAPQQPCAAVHLDAGACKAMAWDL